MLIAILAVGMRGDVQPFVALGVGLQRARHDVRVGTLPVYRELVASQGLEFAALRGGDPQEWIKQEEMQKRMGFGLKEIRTMREGIRMYTPMMKRFLSDSWEACQGAQVVIASMFAIGGLHAAEKLKVPFCWGFQTPYGLTGDFPCPLLLPAGPYLGRRLNRLTHRLTEQLFWRPFRGLVNQWRRESLGMPAVPWAGPYRWMRENRIPRLYGFSALVVPKPPEWPDWWHVTGYWLLERSPDWRPQAELVDFLAAGPPPVYVGFGSTRSRDPGKLTQVVVEALRRAGQRGILLTGWGGLDKANLPEHVFAIESIPFDWLFPQSSLGVRMRTENGLAKPIEILERLLTNRSPN